MECSAFSAGARRIPATSGKINTESSPAPTKATQFSGSIPPVFADFGDSRWEAGVGSEIERRCRKIGLSALTLRYLAMVYQMWV